MYYADQGFEVFATVFETAAITMVRNAVAAACVRFRGGDEACITAGVSLASYTEQHPERNPGVAARALSGEPYILGNLAGLSEEFRTFLVHEPLWELAAMILRTDVVDVVYHFAQVIRKPARIGPAVSWHRDYPNTYVCSRTSNFVRLLVALDDMSYVNGGTGIVPESHLIDDEEVWRRRDLAENGGGAVYPTMEAGQVLAIHPKAVHGGGPNRSPSDRDLLVTQFGVRSAELIHRADAEYLTLCGREEFLAG